MKPETTRKSLRRHMVIYFSVLILLVVGGYTFGLRFFFFKGLQHSMSDVMELEILAFAKDYQENPQTIPPNSKVAQFTMGQHNLPPLIQEMFPTENHRHGIMNYREDYVEQKLNKVESFRITFLMPYQLHDGKWCYMHMQLTEQDFSEASMDRFERTATLIFPIAGLCLLLFFCAVFYMVGRLTRPMEQMALWAESLTLESKGSPLPGFQYHELDEVASKLQSAFQRIGEVLENEHRFLCNASHELRTPIAVISNNAELLERLLKDQDKASLCVGRIHRSAANMRHLTETLLWLSRENEASPQVEPVAIDELIKSLVDERRYLLDGKQIELRITCHSKAAYTAITPFRIALGNLIRNAFQYTSNGEVTIDYTSNEVLVRNVNRDQETIDEGGADYGYGLGLALVDMLTERIGWSYLSKEIPGGREVVLGGFERVD